MEKEALTIFVVIQNFEYPVANVAGCHVVAAFLKLANYLETKSEKPVRRGT